MAQSKATSKQISETVGIGLRTAQKWIARIEQNPDITLKKSRNGIKDNITLKEQLEATI